MATKAKAAPKDKKSTSKTKDKVSTKDNAKTKSKDKELTPLEKARIAKASGKAPKAGAKKKKVIPTWKAPEDLKPHFLEVLVKTDKDGLLSNLIKATRYQGRYDPQADEKKKFDLGSYDQPTLLGLLSRLSMTTYTSNAAKRLPANTTYKILLRITKKSKDGTIGAAFKAISYGKKSESGRVKAVELDKKDPQYRLFRKSNKILPGAFKDVLQPPKKVRGQKVKESDDE